MIETKSIDKSKWPDGPWKTEPDRVEFEHAGLPCLMLRSEKHGAWCGYAAVPPGHPLHGTAYGEVDADVHGGLSYSSACSGSICHEPEPGKPDNVWWFGFDCLHAWDVVPLYEWSFGPDSAYQTEGYVRHQVKRLAEQLAAHA